MFSQLSRATRIGLVVAAGALLAACSSGPNGPQVASVGGTTTTTTTSSAGGDASQGAKHALAFSACMRAHGVKNFPDPQISGNGTTIKVGGPGINPNSPTFQSAQKACQKDMPVPSAAPGKGADPTKVAAWAACMRAHGLPHFPDPTIDNGALKLNLTGTGLDPQSGAFQNAMSACKSKDPGGPMMIGAGPGNAGSANPGGGS
jgi:hypothetical protein